MPIFIPIILEKEVVIPILVLTLHLMSMIRAPLITSPWPLYSSISILLLVNNVVEYLWSSIVTNICLSLAYSILRSYG